MQELSLIDKSAELQSIKQKYGRRYFADPEALKEACTLWGVKSNEHGVVLDFNEEELVKAGKCKASMSYIETTTGHVLIGLDVSTAIDSFGYAPSVWSGTGFASYWDARLFAVQKFIDYFESVALSNNSFSSEDYRKNIERALALLKDEMMPQLELF